MYTPLLSDVSKPVHHHTIQINQPTRCNNFTSLLLDVYVWLNIFRAPLRPSSGAYSCTRSLWFYRWSVVVGALLVVVYQTSGSTVGTWWLERCWSWSIRPLVLPLVRGGWSVVGRGLSDHDQQRFNGRTRGS